MSNFASVILLEIEMKIRVYIIGFLIVMAVMGSCKPPQASPRPSPEGEGEAYRTLEEIDSLMWERADSAFAMLQALVVSPMADSLDEFEEHYCQLLISELLYKNYYAQSNRENLLKAVGYFDSLAMTDGWDAEKHNASLQERNVFLDARSHYINGAGLYEKGSVVEACAEYLKALEIMENWCDENELAGKKVIFMFYTYNRLLELFSAQFMMDPAIACGERALTCCQKEPSLFNKISNINVHIGKQYDKKGQNAEARQYYISAIESMASTDNLLYRDATSAKALCDYQLGYGLEQSIAVLKNNLSNASSEMERFTRFMTIGYIYYEEGVLDSAMAYLEPVFLNAENQLSKVKSAEYLYVIYDRLGDKGKSDECMRFLAEYKKSEGESKAMVSLLENLYQDYQNRKWEKRAEISRQTTIKKAIGIIIPITLAVALAIVVLAKNKSKKLLEKQQAEADKVLEEAEQRLKEVERKHQQWMAEAKERHAEELMAQRDMSEKEIEKTKERHTKELEAEREAYQKEREALRQILQSKEEQVRDLEMTLSQQQEEIVRRREAFLKEPVCKRINDLLHGRHITTRDTSYQHDDITLKEKDFKQLKEAVERHFEGFDAALSGRCPSLKHNDLTLCHLYLMGLSEGEIAALRSRTYSGIKKQNESLHEKLGLDEGVAAYVLRVAEDLCGTPTRSISQNSTLKGTLKSTWSETLKGTQKKIVEIIINNPNVTIPQVAEQLDLNPRGIAKHFKALQEKGVIRRIGPDKGGHWEVMG